MVATVLAGQTKESSSKLAACAAYSVALAALVAAAQLLYSPLGFNPTDDGFVLAASRRLIDGQIPHLDFISVRPVGSAILHLPFVLFSGAHTLIDSRLFVWFELASVALAWTVALRRAMGFGRRPGSEIAIAASAFALGTHYFPVMAWPTIDGLFLGGIGLLLAINSARRAQAVGYALLGAACLCKQNFGLLAPAAILLTGPPGRWWAWAAAALPAVAYLAVLAVAGAVPDAALQLTTQTDLGVVGFAHFLWEPATAWGLLLGYVAMRALATDGRPSEPRTVTMRLVAGAGLLVAVLAAGQALAQGRYLGAPSFGLFGLALGATLQSALDPGGRREDAAAGALASLAAWCSAISIGYNTPALGSGIAAAYLLWRLHVAAVPIEGAVRHFGNVLIPGVLAIVLLADFHLARERFVYLDRPSAELNAPLGTVLAGGDGVRTGPNTHVFLADLNTAVRLASPGRYAILPGVAAHWLESSQANPLPIDWAQPVDLGRPELVERVDSALDAARGHLTLIVAKVQAATLAHGFAPQPDSGRFPVSRYIRRHFRKVGETRFFELYR